MELFFLLKNNSGFGVESEKLTLVFKVLICSDQELTEGNEKWTNQVFCLVNPE